ncbi:glycosyltransferase [Conexibacter sp. SYSU D00693]|uniref:glycosyltransferase n=1 Tax=Conexibacter sp. SYSU D00693 TaxID=2812560 RepID=UPI00196B9FF8|nr:glycosyltransferase [Conexibacter sp. SYSU D00693]
MRVLVFHGYLLRGTGSNVYNARLAAALARRGHEVHLLSQESRPEEVEGLLVSGRVHVHRPDIGRVLPVYVADRYEGFDARPFTELDDATIEEYVARNVAAVREVAGAVEPDVALANHLVMGPVVLARALGDRVPYAVKIHGSALEYTVKRDPGRFMPYAREGLAGARAVLVGSRHTAESLWAAMGDGDGALRARTRLGPPGVDVELFRPRPRDEAAAAVRDLARELRAAPPPARTGSSFDRDPVAAAGALDRLRPDDDRHVAYVGKLIVSKGVDLLAAAWPLVLAAEPRARLVVVGFGAYREAFERLLAALGRGDLQAVRELAQQGRAAEGGPQGRLDHLLAFLDGLEADPVARGAYLEAAARIPDRVLVVGRLEHEELAPVLALCEAQVVPSTFPEAFGMVAAEAAAAGALPVSARHSGLAEVATVLAEPLGAAAADLLTFPLGDVAVEGLAGRLVRWLGMDEGQRAPVRDALVDTARRRFSWEGVADGVVLAAQGRVDELPEPPPPAPAPVL